MGACSLIEALVSPSLAFICIILFVVRNIAATKRKTLIKTNDTIDLRINTDFQEKQKYGNGKSHPGEDRNNNEDIIVQVPYIHHIFPKPDQLNLILKETTETE